MPQDERPVPLETFGVALPHVTTAHGLDPIAEQDKAALHASHGSCTARMPWSFHAHREVPA